MNLGNYSFLIIIVLMVGVMWWMQRSQRKQQQKRQEQVNSLTKDTDVVTIGGLHGKIDSVGETTIDLDCEGVILTFEKSAVRPPMAQTARPVSNQPKAPEVVETKTEAKTDTSDDGIER